MMKKMDIETTGDEMNQMKMFRSGKKREDGKPRPLIVTTVGESWQRKGRSGRRSLWHRT
jgi:hypothetical protein